MKFEYLTPEERKEKHRKIRDEISIIDYANMHGIKLVKVGRYFSLEEHDSVRINPDKNRYFRNSVSKDSHSVIDFAVEFAGKSLPEAFDELTEMLIDENYKYTVEKNRNVEASKKENPEKEKKEIILPKHDYNVRNVFAYLVKTRKIDKSIVSHFIHERMIYQDEKKNCVFVSRDPDGKPVFACYRSSHPKSTFKGDVVGCNYDECFYINNNAKKTIVLEAVIDGLSFMTLLKDSGEKIASYNYLMLGSSNKYNSVFYHMANKPKVEKYLLAFDNDEAGWIAIENIKKGVEDMKKNIELVEKLPTKGKDWNDELKFIKGGNIKEFKPDDSLYEHLAAYYSVKKGYSMSFDTLQPTTKNSIENIVAAHDKKVEQLNVPKELVNMINDLAEFDAKHPDIVAQIKGRMSPVDFVIEKYNQKDVDFLKSYKQLFQPKVDKELEKER